VDQQQKYLNGLKSVRTLAEVALQIDDAARLRKHLEEIVRVTDEALAPIPLGQTRVRAK
jgi:hypothetical protein